MGYLSSYFPAKLEANNGITKPQSNVLQTSLRSSHLDGKEQQGKIALDDLLSTSVLFPCYKREK
jgi:hypothetical protein